jgi:hypothetical protein
LESIIVDAQLSNGSRLEDEEKIQKLALQATKWQELGLGAVYTMDHEVVPRKRPILRGTTSWDEFHGPS